MKKIKISLMNDNDREEIVSWQEKYAKTEGFDAIRHYILEDYTYYTLNDVLNINFEHFPIGDDERQFLFVAKNKEEKLVAWLLCDCIDMTCKSPELFIQYVVVHPLHQHEGYGTALANEIILNSEKYIGLKPKKYFAYIDDTNTSSRNLFKKFGFSFRRMTPTYSRAVTTTPKLENNKQIEPGE